MFSCVAHVGFVLGLAYLFSSLVFNFIFYPKPYSLTYLHWLCYSRVFCSWSTCSHDSYSISSSKSSNLQLNARVIEFRLVIFSLEIPEKETFH
jgi:hypothetical protein